MDAKSASRALSGIDTAVRYFVAAENPALGAIDYPLPVRVQRGSWEALIPFAIVTWITWISGQAASEYVKTAAKKIAENDFKDASTARIFQNALRSLQRLIVVGKHLGHTSIRLVNGPKWDREKEGLVGLPNERGEVLYVPVESLKALSQCPPRLLSDVASVVEEGRELVVGVRVGDTLVEASISQRERHIFFTEEGTDEDILFPELAHGSPVSLEGVVTRENGRTKTLGFLYQGHVLTCMPASGNILPFKKHLFLPCRIEGHVTREDVHGAPTEKRPKILFRSMEILSDQEQLGLEFHDAESD